MTHALILSRRKRADNLNLSASWMPLNCQGLLLKNIHRFEEKKIYKIRKLKEIKFILKKYKLLMHLIAGKKWINKPVVFYSLQFCGKIFFLIIIIILSNLYILICKLHSNNRKKKNQPAFVAHLFFFYLTNFTRILCNTIIIIKVLFDMMIVYW